VSDDAVKGLNGLEIRGKTLSVRRAQARQGAGQPMPLGLPGMLPGLPIGIPGLPIGLGVPSLPQQPPTRVLCLMQMVSPDELTNDREYKEISEDIQSECSKYGQVKSLIIPRPSPQGPVPGLGKVFVEFAAPEMAAKARGELEGRQFASRVVATTYWDEGRFAQKDLA